MADGDLLAALRALPGVLDAHLEVEPGGVPSHDSGARLWLELADDADEATVTASVNALLSREYGLGVERPSTQVTAPVTEPDPGPNPEPTTPVVASDPTREKRARLQRVSYRHEGLGLTCWVSLVSASVEHVGSADAAATPAGQNRALATATVRALEQVARGAARFEVEFVDLVHVGGEQLAVVVITVLTEAGAQRLTGSCEVADEPRQAVVKATLAATNRVMELIVGP